MRAAACTLLWRGVSALPRGSGDGRRRGRRLACEWQAAARDAGASPWHPGGQARCAAGGARPGPKASAQDSTGSGSGEAAGGGGGDADFGFRRVPAGEKKGMVADVFSNVARNYDIMNDLMSAGMHRLWKDDFVSMLGIRAALAAGHPPPRVLDVAGGTGDIAFRMVDDLRPYLAGNPGGGAGEGEGGPAALPEVPWVTVSDINPDMLEVGKQRALRRFPAEAAGLMEWRQADAERLEGLQDNAFHLYTVAFGLRNVTDVDKALREACRVLRPGGRFMCLEFSQVEGDAIRSLYDWYSFQVIPRLGQAVAGDHGAYQYLVESIRMFPTQRELEERMSAAGFRHVTHTNLTAGVVAVHSGFKPFRP